MELFGEKTTFVMFVHGSDRFLYNPVTPLASSKGRWMSVIVVICAELVPLTAPNCSFACVVS